jgi:hypothetical protein
MAEDGPEWFAPKRFGYGGRPVTWQGWLVILVYAAIVVATSRLLGHKSLAMAGVLVPATAILILIVAKTTRGGWRWRWDKESDR